MFGKHFELNEQTMHIVKAIGRMMPGGFFIYRANETEELLYASRAYDERYLIGGVGRTTVRN